MPAFFRQVAAKVKEPLSFILVDNCCEERKFYERIFGQVPVKLDVWHGIKRLVHVLPKNFPWRSKVSQVLGLIVRQEVCIKNKDSWLTKFICAM